MKLLDKLFRKKDKSNRSNYEKGIIDLPLLGPYDNLISPPYVSSNRFDDFEDNFITDTRDFVKKTNLDKYNKGYRDHKIEQSVKESCDYGDLQETEHIWSIDSITRLRIVERMDAEIRLKQIPEERFFVQETLRKLEEIYYAGTALEGNADNAEKKESGYDNSI